MRPVASKETVYKWFNLDWERERINKAIGQWESIYTERGQRKKKARQKVSCI